MDAEVYLQAFMPLGIEQCRVEFVQTKFAIDLQRVMTQTSIDIGCHSCTSSLMPAIRASFSPSSYKAGIMPEVSMLLISSKKLSLAT